MSVAFCHCTTCKIKEVFTETQDFHLMMMLASIDYNYNMTAKSLIEHIVMTEMYQVIIDLYITTFECMIMLSELGGSDINTANIANS